MKSQEADYLFSMYPMDVENHREWDAYWRGRAWKEERATWESQWSSWIEIFRRRGLDSILFVGNGLSPEPQLFSYAGFSCVSLELSTVANERVSQWSLPRHDATLCLDCKEQSSCWLARIERGHQKAQFVTGSLFDAHCCSDSFDVVVIRRTLHLFEGRRLHEALRRLRERLRPGGVLVVEIHFDEKAYKTLCQLIPRYQWILRDPKGPTSSDWTAAVLFT